MKIQLSKICLNEMAQAKDLSVIRHKGNLYLIGKNYLIPVSNEAEANKFKKQILEGEKRTRPGLDKRVTPPEKTYQTPRMTPPPFCPPVHPAPWH